MRLVFPVMIISCSFCETLSSKARWIIETSKRGRGTKKSPVIGAAERGGKVVARVATDLTSRSILKFIRDNIKPEDFVLITDEYKAYNAVRKSIDHHVIKHSERFVDDEHHTNTIEDFWSLRKRAWYGQHYHYQKGFMPLYIAEAVFKSNHRKNSVITEQFIRGCFVWNIP